MPVSRLVRRLAAVGLAGLVAACSGGGSPSAPASNPLPSSGTAATSSPAACAQATPLTVGLGYIPSVQFAAFYLAQQEGLYDGACLKVSFQNKIDPELVTLVGQGAIDIGLADGTSVIPAVSQGIPDRYLATIYGRFPSIVFAKASSGITTAADLRGRKLGIPGRYGSSWIMLQALLASAGLKTSDLTIVEYPDFGQGAAVAAGAIDAATGFTNNEPVQLKLAGTPTTILSVDSSTPLPGPGLIASTSTIAAKHEALKAFVAATLQAMREIVAEPSKGLDASIAAVPDLGKDRATQAAILAATIDTWQSPLTASKGLGALDPAGWTTSIAFMTKLGLVPKPISAADVLQTGLLP